MKTSILTALLLLGVCLGMSAQGTYPTISPTANYTDADGTEHSETNITESAPLDVTFKANTEDADGWTAHYEWHFYRQDQRDEPYLIRYDEDTEYTFNAAGAHYVELWATFTLNEDTVAYADTYYQGEGGQPITISISESRLEMPNAFSPNGDGINDVYKAKSNYQSIVDFHAYIFNRWGKKLYEWNDPAGGWDGKYNGKDVAQGVYYVLVKARGADGRKFNIKRDVNLLRGYTEKSGTDTDQ